MTAFVVTMHTGPHQPGEVVDITEEHEAAGVDAQRLLDIGAVRLASDEEAERATPIGVPLVEQFKPLPWIDPMLQGLHVSTQSDPPTGQAHREIALSPGGVVTEDGVELSGIVIDDLPVTGDAEARAEGEPAADEKPVRTPRTAKK